MCATYGTQEGDEVPRDWTALFDTSLYKYDASLVPEALALYDKLQIKKTALTLITPQVRS
jgi:intraflagellar transport protein 52